MRRTRGQSLLSLAWGVVCWALLPAADGRAVEMPVRKAGLWEMQMSQDRLAACGVTMQHCTDESTDKRDEHRVLADVEGNHVPKQSNVEKTATGYVSDSECSVAGMTMTSHADISAISIPPTPQDDVAQRAWPLRLPRDATTTIEAKWLGACKPDQKPGDIVNARRLQDEHQGHGKLKGLVPK